MSYKTITREEVQEGDEVQIGSSDKDWYKIGSIVRDDLGTSYGAIWSYSNFIKGFRRKCKVFEGDLWLSGLPGEYGLIEEFLQEAYGSPPIIYTYNGEPAEQFGLTKDSGILLFDACDYWVFSDYYSLSIGNNWIKQPMKPKEVSNHGNQS